MTTRLAELLMAVVMAIFSLYLMWKSAELPVGWIPGEGPGGGAFSFWLAAGMLACCAWIVVKWVRRAGSVAASTAPFWEGRGLRLFLIVAGALTVMIGAIHVIGVYFAVPLFLAFYMRILGGHGWAPTASIAVISPVVIFLFFEIALTITLPKGFTEPLFYPLYEFFY